MKLQLSVQKGIQVLTVDGPLSPQHVKVLKAGITKLFKDGKNRLIVEFKSAKDFPDDIIREIGVLNLVARELAGEVVLLIAETAVRAKVENFGKPNPCKAFAKMEEALGAFSGEAPAAGAVSKSDSERDEEIKKLKELLRQKETGELSSIRAENSQLKQVNAQLEERLEKMVVQRREPPDEKALRDKIRTLEDEVGALMTQAAAAEAQKKKA